MNEIKKKYCFNREPYRKWVDQNDLTIKRCIHIQAIELLEEKVNLETRLKNIWIYTQEDLRKTIILPMCVSWKRSLLDQWESDTPLAVLIYKTTVNV